VTTIDHGYKFNPAKQNNRQTRKTESREKSSGAVTDNYNRPEMFDHVLIDANQFIHSTLRKSYNKHIKHSKHMLSKSENKNNVDNSFDDDKSFRDVTDRSLSLLLRELNAITSNIAIPRKSLVIALDGSPGAAKLDMQRRRRFGIYKKAENQMKQLQILRERGWRDSDIGFINQGNVVIDDPVNVDDSSKQNSANKNPSISKHDREQITLNITPGTAYMDRVTDALLYWAWKCVSNPFWPKFDNNGYHVANNNKMSRGRVKIYINPSYVPGEGEIKLLDWIMRGHESHFSAGDQPHIRPGETVAILGGDSDLVLMGLVVPPSLTHNVHIILPGELRKSLVVSIWKTTRVLANTIEGNLKYGAGKKSRKKVAIDESTKRLTLKEIRNARLDMTLLILLNGNDYLPRIRGCGGGFDVFFRVYLHVIQGWRKKYIDDESMPPFLINVDDNDELYLNVPFALAFFQQLLLHSQEPTEFEDPNDESSSFQSHLGVLKNLIEAKFLPGPLEFQTLSPESKTHQAVVESFQSELLQMNTAMKQDASKVMKEVFADDEVEIIRMTLGDFPDHVYASHVAGAGINDLIVNTDDELVETTILGGANDGHGVISKMIKSGGGRSYLFEVPHRAGTSLRSTRRRLASLALEEIFGKENADDLFRYDNLDDDDMNDDPTSFKTRSFAEANATSYLGGILWNLDTYQQGCSADFGYNYGIRSAPTPFEIVNLLEIARNSGELTLSRRDLIDASKSRPLSDGLSCLAALPPQAWHLVPEPYNKLADEDFNTLYSSCIDPESNVFDALLFEKKCQSKMKGIANGRKRHDMVNGKIDNENGRNAWNGANGTGRRIYAGDNFWTVISCAMEALDNPFEPPDPYGPRVSKLRRNRKIRASKIPVTPGHGDRRNSKSELNDTKNGFHGNRGKLDEGQCVYDMPFKTVFNDWKKTL